jgi:hypothetical protein
MAKRGRQPPYAPEERAFGRRCYRHWIEIRDVRDHHVRRRKICYG